MMKKYFLVILLCLTFGVALAADPPPLALMKNVSSRMMTSLRQNKGRLHNRSVIHGIVNRVVVPYFDLTSVARSVVGRRYWYQASSSSRSRFISAFKRYVINMYATALSSYSDEVIKFRPMRGYNSGQKRVRIYSVVQRSGARPINLNYRLVSYGSNWKIYDFSVAGVSMVQSYRSQFASVLSQKGLDGLTKQLRVKR